uniref:ABC transporter domain-containing protein n=1 Tax=Oryza glumipatula TaxID=40148 RepID=A0A0D9ZR27_9ORYZ
MAPLKPPPPRLLLNGVSCMRNAQTVLRDINVSVHDGTALVLTGANGSGKSTFLRMLAGFSRPSAGEVLWNGHDITSPGVFQQYKLQLNWMSLKDAVKEKLTVLENVQWFELLEGKHGKSAPAIELMGLGRLMNEKARMLSMGQRKRLQLARLLAIDRPIWLLDEPSVALDAEGVKLLEYIIAEHRKKGGIVFVATHLPIEIEDAMSLRLPQRFPRRKTLVDLMQSCNKGALNAPLISPQGPLEVLSDPMLEVAGPLSKTRYKATSQSSTKPPILHKCALPNLEDASVEYVRNGSRSKIIFILQTIRSSLKRRYGSVIFSNY